MVNGIGTVYIQASDGVRRHKHRRRRRNLASHQHLLHVAARQLPYGSPDARGHDLEVVNDMFGKFFGVLSVHEHETTFGIGTQHHVIHEVHVSYQPHAKSVFGHERKPDSQIPYLYGGFLHKIDLGFLFVRIEIQYVAARGFLKSRNGFQQFSLSAARYPGDTEYLSRTRRKRHVVKRFHAVAVQNRQIFDYQSVLNVFRLRPFDVQFDFFTDHHFGQSLFVGFRGIDGGYMLALSQNCDPVGYCHDLVQFMRDDDYGLSVVAHAAQNGEKFIDLLRGQNRGRLVENEYFRPAVQYFYDFDGLLFGNGHVVNLFL